MNVDVQRLPDAAAAEVEQEVGYIVCAIPAKPVSLADAMASAIGLATTLRQNVGVFRVHAVVVPQTIQPERK